MHNIFLILGTQRSGTTLLSKIMSSHSTVYVQNETYLPRLFKDIELQPDSLIERIGNYVSQKAQTQSNTKSINLLALKDPQLTEHMDILETLAPTVKMVIIVRDPRGVVNSYIDNKWGLGTNAYTGALRWKNEVGLQLYLSEKFKDQIFFIKFEDLISDLQANLAKICNFLDIEFENKMMSYDKNSNYISTTKENKNINKKPDKNISTKWNKKLSFRQIGIIETITQNEMEKMGYEPIIGKIKISPLAKKYYELHQVILGELQLQYRLRKIRFLIRYKKLFK